MKRSLMTLIVVTQKEGRASMAMQPSLLYHNTNRLHYAKKVPNVLSRVTRPSFFWYDGYDTDLKKRKLKKN